MDFKEETEKYVAFLRGINVGGHHKVPMAELRETLEKLNLENVITLLNSGNVIFDAVATDLERLENTISETLEKTFGFPIPIIIRKAEIIQQLFLHNPFQEITITKDIRLYVSFLKKDTSSDLKLPWKSADNSFIITEKRAQTIVSILDLSVAKTPKAMEVLEKSFGKDITTRNWKTIERIIKKLPK